MEIQIFYRLIKSLIKKKSSPFATSTAHGATQTLKTGVSKTGQVTYPTLSGEAVLTKGSPNWWHMGGFCFGQELRHIGSMRLHEMKLYFLSQNHWG